MTDIDLVPAAYRQQLWLYARVRRLGGVIVVMMMISLLAYTGFHTVTNRNNETIAKLQQQQEITTQQRNALSQLDGKRKKLEGQLQLLEGLRSGVEAPEMFSVIDRSIPAGEVWFNNWEFRRAGSIVKRQEEVSSNGYFIIIPAQDDTDSTEAWKIETHMTVKGRAKDHSTLSRFVRQLFEQPEIEDIRILNTASGANGRYVNFNLAIIVHSKSTQG